VEGTENVSGIAVMNLKTSVFYQNGCAVVRRCTTTTARQNVATHVHNAETSFAAQHHVFFDNT
jgi:ABC-type xylose transport system permease subunit